MLRGKNHINFEKHPNVKRQLNCNTSQCKKAIKLNTKLLSENVKYQIPVLSAHCFLNYFIGSIADQSQYW